MTPVNPPSGPRGVRPPSRPLMSTEPVAGNEPLQSPAYTTDRPPTAPNPSSPDARAYFRERGFEAPNHPLRPDMENYRPIVSIEGGELLQRLPGIQFRDWAEIERVEQKLKGVIGTLWKDGQPVGARATAYGQRGVILWLMGRCDDAATEFGLAAYYYATAGDQPHANQAIFDQAMARIAQALYQEQVPGMRFTALGRASDAIVELQASSGDHDVSEGHLLPVSSVWAWFCNYVGILLNPDFKATAHGSKGSALLENIADIYRPIADIESGGHKYPIEVGNAIFHAFDIVLSILISAKDTTDRLGMTPEDLRLVEEEVRFQKGRVAARLAQRSSGGLRSYYITPARYELLRVAHLYMERAETIEDLDMRHEALTQALEAIQILDGLSPTYETARKLEDIGDAFGALAEDFRRRENKTAVAEAEGKARAAHIAAAMSGTQIALASGDAMSLQRPLELLAQRSFPMFEHFVSGLPQGLQEFVYGNNSSPRALELANDVIQIAFEQLPTNQSSEAALVLAQTAEWLAATKTRIGDPNAHMAWVAAGELYRKAGSVEDAERVFRGYLFNDWSNPYYPFLQEVAQSFTGGRLDTQKIGRLWQELVRQSGEPTHANPLLVFSSTLAILKVREGEDIDLDLLASAALLADLSLRHPRAAIRGHEMAELFLPALFATPVGLEAARDRFDGIIRERLARGSPTAFTSGLLRASGLSFASISAQIARMRPRTLPR